MIKIFANREDHDGQHMTLSQREIKEASASSILELFADLDGILARIPSSERYNLHYSLCNCVRAHGRKFLSQDVYAIDIDGMKPEHLPKFKEYLAIVARVFKLPEDNVLTINSGNGLHFLFMTDDPWHEESYFSDNRIYWRALCMTIDYEIKKSGLTGTCDQQIFAPAHTLRLPCTANIKRGKEERQSQVLQGALSPLPINLQALCESITIKDADVTAQISDLAVEHLTHDTDSVLGCPFIRWCADHPNDVSEPQWVAMLSVVARVPNGAKLAHKLSSEYHAYDMDETDLKISQVLGAKGARTCDNIATMFAGCATCEHRNKIASPLLLSRFASIKSKHTGYWNTKLNKSGENVPDKPNYDDLLKVFEMEHPYCVCADSSIVYIHTGSHWQPILDNEIRSWMYDTMSPHPGTMHMKEFLGRLLATHQVRQEFFEYVNGVNLQNGWIDLETGVLHKHSVDKGFTYVLPYNYNPDASAPVFTKFLDEVTCGDDELKQALTEYAAYCISAKPCSWGEKCLIMLGGGANGKSVFADVLKMVIGRENTQALTMADLQKPEMRFLLWGSLVNIAEETPSKSLSDSSVFKNLVTGGDTTVKMLYKQSFNMRSKTKLVFACNELPKANDSTRGLFRRLLIVPFRASFEGKEDKDMRDKLAQEVQGIFNIFLRSYHDLTARGRFVEPKRSKIVAEEYHKQVLERDEHARTLFNIVSWSSDTLDIMAVDVDGCTQEMFDNSAIKMRDLYTNYSAWCQAGGIKAVDITQFGQHLRITYPVINERTTRKVCTKTKRKETFVNGVRYFDSQEEF